jgi:hypothetical protein
MCGPSAEEKSLQRQSADFSSMLQQNYTTLFGKQLDVLGAINKSLSPILAAGPNQRGFSGAERSAFDTQAINQAGAANRAAQQAARTYGAGQGGGATSGVTSGITKQIQSAIASQSAQALGTQENQIERADFATGRENYWRAQGGMDALAAGYSPNAAASGAINENQASFGEANTIHQQDMEMGQMIAGGLTSLAGAGLTFAGGFAGGGGLSGGLKALGGKH